MSALKRVIVNGAHGKMGSLACKTIDSHPDFVLVAALGKEDNLAQAIINQQADIVVELTRADVVFKNSQTIIECGAHPVIGASGLHREAIQQLSQLAENKQLGGIIAPNFSIGAVMMMQMAAQVAPYFQQVEIVETHHAQKYDAPSGTALKTAELIAAHQSQQIRPDYHEAVPGALGGKHCNIPIHSLRLPGTLARQQVIFGNSGETLTIYHDSIDRNCFMPGIILCCQKVTSLNKLYYGLEHFLDK